MVLKDRYEGSERRPRRDHTQYARNKGIDMKKRVRQHRYLQKAYTSRSAIHMAVSSNEAATGWRPK